MRLWMVRVMRILTIYPLVDPSLIYEDLICQMCVQYSSVVSIDLKRRRGKRKSFRSLFSLNTFEEKIYPLA